MVNRGDSHARYVVLIGSTLVPQPWARQAGASGWNGGSPARHDRRGWIFFAGGRARSHQLTPSVAPLAVAIRMAGEEAKKRRGALVTVLAWYALVVWAGRHRGRLLVHLGYHLDKSIRGGRQNQDGHVETNGERRDALSSSCNLCSERKAQARCWNMESAYK